MKKTLLILFSLLPFLLPAEEIPLLQTDSIVNSHSIVVGKISLEGNRITQPYIIYREIIIKEGDTLTESIFKTRLEQSRLNLLNTSLFNFVNFDTVADAFGVINLKFSMIERWYLFPFPIFEISDRNFNTWLDHRDWRRVNYGGYIKWSNLRGRMEELNLLIRFGYDERYRLIYDIPYINTKQSLGLTFVASINQNHEVAYNTENNKPVFFRGENYILQNYLFSTGLNYRPSIFNTYSAIIGYNRFDYSTKLTELNPEYAPGSASQLNLVKGTLYLRNDHRDSKPYPIKGYFADAEITAQKGIYSGNQKYYNTYLYANLNSYNRFNQRWYWSAGTTFKISKNKNKPFFLNQGLGYGKDYIRGYEYYVIDGSNYFLVRTNIKYNLLKPHVKYIKITGSEKFDKIHYTVFFNIFADVGAVFTTINNNVQPSILINNVQTLNNRLLRGIGVGLDLVTYYDKVLRVEYSINHLGQGGFYIHLESSL